VRNVQRELLLTSYRFSIQPLTILGVTGPFSVLAENIYSLCQDSFHVSNIPMLGNRANDIVGRLPLRHGMVSHPCWSDAPSTGHI
jgi:hypothetical protein